MIEIIERGSKEVINCKKCGCKFSYEKEDIQNIDIDNYKGWKEVVICPQCSCEVIVRQTKMLGGRK